MTLICLPAEVEAINSDGIRVRMPIKGRAAPVEIDSRKLPGKVTAAGPAGINPSDYDLVALGDAGAAVPLARRARTARRGGEIAASPACRS